MDPKNDPELLALFRDAERDGFLVETLYASIFGCMVGAFNAPGDPIVRASQGASVICEIMAFLAKEGIGAEKFSGIHKHTESEVLEASRRVIRRN